MEPIVDDEYLFGIVERDCSCGHCFGKSHRSWWVCIACRNKGWWVTYRRIWGYE